MPRDATSFKGQVRTKVEKPATIPLPASYYVFASRQSSDHFVVDIIKSIQGILPLLSRRRYIQIPRSARQNKGRNQIDGTYCTVSICPSECSRVAMGQLISSHLMMEYYGHCSSPDCCQVSLILPPSTESQSRIALFLMTIPQICLVPPRRDGVLSSTTLFTVYTVHC